jgi:outer membrane protein
MILFLTLLSAGTIAQTATQPTGTVQKIGYADWEYIFSQMPEFKQIDSQLKTHGTQLEAQLKAKYTEYDTKLKAYQAGAATMIDAVRKDKETELTQLQENMNKFQQDAQTSLQKKQTDLMEPVYAKVGKAIEEVAKENAYSFIISPQVVGGGDILLYSDEKFNISVLVLKKMGITPAAPVAVQPK